jgi:hypothetical protein
LATARPKYQQAAGGVTKPYLLLEGVWASVRMYGREAPLAHLVEAARALTAAARLFPPP